MNKIIICKKCKCEYIHEHNLAFGYESISICPKCGSKVVFSEYNEKNFDYESYKKGYLAALSYIALEAKELEDRLK